MLFSLELQRDNRQNVLAVAPTKGKTGKKLYFHYTVEMKQPHTITEPIEIQRIGIVFSRTNRLKLWVASVCCGGSSIFGGFPLKGMAEPIAFCRENRRRLFYLHSMVKNTGFFSSFPLADCMIAVFRCLFTWNFKK